MKANKSQGHMKQDSHETRIALLEQSIININQTLIRLENKMDDGFNEIKKELISIELRVNYKIDNLESRLNSRIDKLELRIDKIDNRLWQIMFLLSSSIIGVVLGKIFHWF